MNRSFERWLNDNGFGADIYKINAGSQFFEYLYSCGVGKYSKEAHDLAAELVGYITDMQSVLDPNHKPVRFDKIPASAPIAAARGCVPGGIGRVSEGTSSLDVQVGGSHYKDLPIQPVEFSTRNNLGFLAGCIVKRICRYDKPGGKGVQDLDKIKHEVDLLKELGGSNGAEDWRGGGIQTLKPKE